MAVIDGINQNLRLVVTRAQEITTQPFKITEGLRSIDRQRQLVAEGKSKTMESRHITGHAVDVVALVDGKPDWTLTHYYKIAQAFAQASHELKVPIRWGGCWKVLTPDMDFKMAVDQYGAECKAQGKRPLIDAVHFELPKANYP